MTKEEAFDEIKAILSSDGVYVDIYDMVEELDQVIKESDIDD